MIQLTETELAKLVNLSQQERRDPRSQAALLLADVLARLSQTATDTSPAASQPQTTGPRWPRRRL